MSKAFRYVVYSLFISGIGGTGYFYHTMKYKDPHAMEIEDISNSIHEQMKHRLNTPPPPNIDNKKHECNEICNHVLEQKRIKCKIMCQNYFSEFVMGAKRGKKAYINHAEIRELWSHGAYTEPSLHQTLRSKTEEEDE